MKLNIYVGLRAIAYIITNGIEVVKHGIKRVNISYDNYYEFIAGQPVSKRVNRRMKRQMRRNLWRFKSRRENLRNLLFSKLGCRPEPLSRTKNLQLRVKGLTQKLTNQELVNVICQLQLKRGYKSLRGVSDNDNSEYLQEIERHEENLKQYPSIAAYLLTLESSKNIIFTRQSYINEFNLILDQQDIDPELREKIFNIIYYQNPLKKGKIGKCKYEPNRVVAHASNPLYQKFRIWRDVMNIVIYDEEMNELDISFEVRKKWFDKCHSGSNLTKASCCKDLGYKKSTSFTWFSGNAIAGNPILKAFTACEAIEGGDEQAYELWQDLYSATENEKLAVLLYKKYQFSDAQIDELLDLDLSKLGYGDFSVKAIRKLLPVMQEGDKLKEAILKVYGKVDLTTVALRNVILEQHFESCQSLVEMIRKKYDISKVQFEIDHLLKLGNKGRKSLAQQNRKRAKFIKENAHLSSYDRLKLQLWEESEGISPYEPGYVIPKEELFTDKYNIDHIVPKSKLFETGYLNMVLAPTKLNDDKDRTTGIDYASKIGLNGEYETVIDKFPESKQQFLKMKDEEIPSDWVSKRQNSDYNTKCFATITKDLPTTNIPNKLINKYQNEWGVNKYNDQNALYYLCRCWVMSNMSQGTVDYFDNLKLHSVGKDSVSLYGIRAELKKIDFEKSPVFMPRVKFTRKTKYGYTPRFALHGETIFGKREKKYRNAKGEIVTEYFYKVRKSVSELTPAMVTNIMDRSIRSKIQSRIEEKGSHEEAMESLIENPVTHNGKPVKRVSIATNASKIYPLHSTDSRGNTAKKSAFERKVDYVFSDKNYALKLSKNDKGKIQREVITLMQFIDALNSNTPVSAGFTIQENDIVKLDGVQYFILGATDTPKLRPVHTLSATDHRTIKADEWERLIKLKVNQLGEVVGEETL